MLQVEYIHAVLSLKLREKHAVPASVTDDVHESFKELIYFLERSARLNSGVEDRDGHAALIQRVNSGFDAVPTEHKLLNYHYNHFHCQYLHVF